MRYLVLIVMLLNFGSGLALSQGNQTRQAKAEGVTGAGTKLQDTEPVYEPKDVDKRAVITERIEPGYTEEAQLSTVEGVLLLSVILSATGRVTDVEVVNGLSAGLTKKAVDAAKKVKFIPAMKDGRRVSVRVKLAYYFVLPGGSYYGDSSKKTYYKYGCHQTIGPNDFVVFKSKKEAEESGYKRANCQ